MRKLGVLKTVGFAAVILPTVAGILNTPPVRAQPRPEPPRFEVASIKPNKSVETGGTWRMAPGGRFSGENIPLKFLLTTAYDLKESQFSGTPGWADSEKYDIIAKGEGNPTQDQMMAMLQGLLADRFKFRYHRVTKEMPVYALVVAKNGTNLRRPGKGSCAAGGVDSPPGQPVPGYCGYFTARRGQVDGAGITISQLVSALDGWLDRPLIDRTRVSGVFDVHLAWSPNDISGNEPDDNAGPSLFTAVGEQLGLRLEATRGAVPILVIDHIEKPAEN